MKACSVMLKRASALSFGAVLMASLVTASCASPSSSNGPKLLTRSPSGDVFTAHIEGELVVVGKPPGCFGILSGDSTYLVVFPEGTSGSERSIRLNPEGEVSLGERIKLGGGFFPADRVGLDDVPASCLTDEVAVVSR